MLNESPAESIRRDLPQLLQADSIFLRSAGRIELVPGDRLLRQGASRSLREENVFPSQLHSPGEVRLRLAVAANAMSPVATPTTSPLSPKRSSVAANPG